ncbi:thermonuclease family protein [Pelagicoccus enzymogenes]|nr:thermonuclease family protein [Pelagicoccus enzymogenes]
MTLRSSSSTSTMIVDVVGAVDGRTVEVLVNKVKERVILAGIGFPPGDPRSEQDCAEVVEEVVTGRRLYMEVFKEVSGCRYVALSSSNGDCLNEMMLRKGLARYESTGVGFIGKLVEAETFARKEGIGVWDENRALFRHLSGGSQDGSSLDAVSAED